MLLIIEFIIVFLVKYGLCDLILSTMEYIFVELHLVSYFLRYMIDGMIIIVVGIDILMLEWSNLPLVASSHIAATKSCILLRLYEECSSTQS